MTRVVVIGGGLSGLVAARHLAEADVEVHLVERRKDVGGRVRSRYEDGFTFDRGFQVLFTAYPAAQRELDYEKLDLRYFTPGATIARPGSRSVLADPLRDPSSLVETVFNREISPMDKLRVLRLQRELAGKREAEIFHGPDTGIEGYLTERGFSRRFVANFAAPFYGGITLDRSLSTSKAVFEYTFKMLSEGRIALPAAGMGAISKQLAEKARNAGVEIALETTAEGVSADRHGATVDLGSETLSPDAVIVATDPPTARELTGIEAIPTDAHGCVTQYFSLPAHEVLSTGKKLILNAQSDAPNHVAPLSVVAPEYTPDNRGLLSVTFLGEREETAAELAEHTENALASWYPGRSFDGLKLLHTERVPFSQFVQPPGFQKNLLAPDAPNGPVFLAGDFMEWSSIHGALSSGRRAAEATLERVS
ncbi:MAG TPA: NAD(P)/FAD-dependent oxidoreductase [Halococcus sp.]|nr:NAD(P)/FAD-dependent oxidoreductase [Halococcus sp.]